MRGSKIVRRGKDSYSFRYDLPPGPDGKRQQKTETVKGSYKDAERRLREILSQIDQGQLSWLPVRKTLGECLDEYLDNIKGDNAGTYEVYVSAFKSFRKQLGSDCEVSGLDRKQIQDAVNRMRDAGMGKGTLALYFSKFHIAMRWACLPNVRYTMQDPCQGVKIPEPEDLAKPVWDDDQSNQFIRYCKARAAKYAGFYRYATLFLMLLASGARVGEILALRWPDVDFDRKSTRICKTVSRKGKDGPPKSRRGFREVQLDEGEVGLRGGLQSGQPGLHHQEGRPGPLHERLLRVRQVLKEGRSALHHHPRAAAHACHDVVAERSFCEFCSRAPRGQAGDHLQHVRTRDAPDAGRHGQNDCASLPDLR